MQSRAQLIEIAKNEKEIVSIAETAAEMLARDNGIAISNSNAIPTIVDAFFKSMIYWLDKNKSKDSDIILDVLGYVNLGINYREAPEDAENKGNFAPITEPGEIFKRAIKDNDDTEDEVEDEA